VVNRLEGGLVGDETHMDFVSRIGNRSEIRPSNATHRFWRLKGEVGEADLSRACRILGLRGQGGGSRLARSLRGRHDEKVVVAEDIDEQSRWWHRAQVSSRWRRRAQ
jgi:hypothetical protein